MSRRSRPPRARRPDLVERRGAQTLLVWAEVGAWLVADEEVAQLVAALDGRTPLDRVVRQLARRWDRPAPAVAAEAGPALALLRSLGVVGPRPAPDERLSIANVTVNVTNRCNLRCAHCYNDPRGIEADAGRLAAALRAARPILDDDATLILLGGEPLIDLDRLEALVDGARDAFGPAPMLSTNGTLIDDAVATRLAALGVDVQVSLDGPDAARHDPVRGTGSFERATAGVRALRDAGVPVTLSMVYDRDGGRLLEPYADLALALGADEVRFIPLRLIGRAAATPERAPDQLAMLEVLLALLERRPELGRLLRRDFFSITRAVCRAGGARTSCGIGRRVVFVDADGAVYPCPNHRVDVMRAGNVLETPLADLVRGSAVMRRVRRDYRVERYGACRRCPVRPWCAGDCRGEVLAATGRIDGASPHCAAMQRLVPRLMWLIADGDPRLDRSTDAGEFL